MHRHMRTLALEAGDGLGPWGMRKQFRRPCVGEEGLVHLVIDVGYTYVKNQIPNSSRSLSARGFWLCM